MFFFACPPQSTPITPPQELKRAKHRSYHLDAQTGIVVKGKINPLGCSPPETWANATLKKQLHQNDSLYEPMGTSSAVASALHSGGKRHMNYNKIEAIDKTSFDPFAEARRQLGQDSIPESADLRPHAQMSSPMPKARQGQYQRQKQTMWRAL